MLLRSHIWCLRIVVGTVLVGAVLAPGAAFSYDGRLTGALWPMPPTQVAHYAAVLIGCTVVLWFGGAVRGRTALLTLLGAGAALIGAHTRTALIAMTVGLVVAAASMFIGHARVRRTAAALGVLAVVAVSLFAPLIVNWFWRGQSSEEATQLTGRTKVWSEILGLPAPLAGTRLWIRTVQQVLQRALDRQQLAGCLPRPRLVRDRDRRDASAGSALPCSDTSPRHQACHSVVPGHLLHGGLDH